MFNYLNKIFYFAESIQYKIQYMQPYNICLLVFIIWTFFLATHIFWQDGKQGVILKFYCSTKEECKKSCFPLITHAWYR